MLVGLRKLVVLAVVFGCVAGARDARAGDSSLPKGEALLDKYVEVTGGPAAYAKLHNRVLTGSLEIPGLEAKASIKIYDARPSNQYVVIDLEGFGRFEEGTNGEVAWALNPRQGPRIKEGEEKVFELRGAAFDGVAGWRKLFKKTECLGTDTVADKPCYKVLVTPHEGNAETHYYDQESNLLVRTSTSIKTDTGTTPIQVDVSDYRKVDGILMPHRRRIVHGFQGSRFAIEKVEHNVEMPKDRFAIPEAIQALLDPEKPEPPPAGDAPTEARTDAAAEKAKPDPE